MISNFQGVSEFLESEVPKQMDGNVLQHPHNEFTPVDVAISRSVQNLMATYGEKVVREAIEVLFKIPINK